MSMLGVSEFPSVQNARIRASLGVCKAFKAQTDNNCVWKMLLEAGREGKHQRIKDMINDIILKDG